MRIESTVNEIVISLPKGIMSISEIQNLIDYFQYRELVANKTDLNTTVSLANKESQQLVKKALIESMMQRKDIWSNLLQEAIEDYAMGKAIEEGIENKPVSREAVFKVFNQKD